MFNFGPTFLWVIFNLIVLYIFMRKFLFNRITNFMEKRAQSIQTDIETASKNKLEAEELKKSYDEQLKSAHREADAILKEARERAEVEYDARLKEAKENIEILMEKAMRDIETERVKMLREIQGKVASLALAAASKVMEANMDTKTNRALVDKFINEEIDEEGAA